MIHARDALLGLIAGSFLLKWNTHAFTTVIRPANMIETRHVETKSVAFRQSRNPFTLRNPSRFMAASDEDDDEDDDENEPLAKGINSVAWLPSVIGKNGPVGLTPTSKVETDVIPLFPLGGIVYTPNSEHILNIFEPRYRQMYSDILMNGTKRFAVSMSHPTEPGRFAQIGVIFELKQLKEVSEQTKDQIKYICSHKVTNRVQIHRILNPEAWQKRDTYLRVEATILSDNDENEDTKPNDVYAAIAAALPGKPSEEKLLRSAFSELVDIQHGLEEDVRFTRASVLTLAVKPGNGTDGLWQTVRLWQNFIDQRLMSRQNELQRDFQEKLQNFLKKERGIKDDELPSAIGFEDLTPALQNEVKELQKRMAVELQPLVLESTLTMQKILEAKDHTARLKLMQYFVGAETKRLTTKKALKGMFATKSEKKDDAKSSVDKAIPAEEQVTDTKKVAEELTRRAESSPKQPISPLYMDEPDAFQ